MVVVSAVHERQGEVADSAASGLQDAAILRALAELGIDDLAKYRIVESFANNPQAATDASTCARDLGLHSLELTASSLEHLYAFGVLDRVAREQSGATAYRLTGDGFVRGRLAWLYKAARCSPPGCRVLSLLAARSLERARKLSRAARGKGGRRTIETEKAERSWAPALAN